MPIRLDEFEQRMESVFLDWDKRDREHQLSHPESEQVLRDGVVDPPLYWSESVRLLFLLKEVNDPAMTKNKKTKADTLHVRSNYWLLPGLREGGISENGKAWDNWEVIARWTKAILDEVDSIDSWPDIEKDINSTAKSRAAQLRRVAVVNVKKEGGGGSADHAKIGDYFAMTKDLLFAQLKQCNPHIIVCGGSSIYQLFRSGVNPAERESELRKHGALFFHWRYPGGETRVVNWFHFGYFSRLTPALKPWAHLGLVKAVRQILGNSQMNTP